MLSYNCLLKNTPAVEIIKDAIEMMVGEYIEQTGKAPFPVIYNNLRKAGVEIDAESAGAIYDGLYGEMNDDGLSTTEEVNDFTGKNFKKQIDSILDDISGDTVIQDGKELGFDSPEKHAVSKIAKLFQKENYGISPKSDSAIKQMQDFVTKAATSLLPKEAKKPVSLTEALGSFFDLESNKFQRLDGQVNTLESLHDAVKEQVKNYVSEVSKGLDSDEAAMFAEQWDNYTKVIMDSAYDIVLNKSNQNSLVNQALQQIQVDGVNIVDVNGNVKWSALLEFGNPDTIAQKVKELFKAGFQDKDGTQKKFTDEQADRIGNYFQRIYEKKLKDAQERAIGNNRVRNMSAKNIISDFIKSRGFFNTVKDKNGNLLLEQADWTNAIGTIKRLLNGVDVDKTSPIAGSKEIRGLDLVENKLSLWLNSQVKEDGSPKFSEEQKRIITDEFVKTALAKLVPATGEPTSLERLIALDKLNQSNAFNEETQQTLNKVVGVSSLSESTLKELQDLAKLAAELLEGGKGDGTKVNRAATAFAAMAEIDRKIKEILRLHKIDSSQWQRVVKYSSDLLGGGTVSLLLNPTNMLENVSTQVFSNLGETVAMTIKNPRLVMKTFGRLQKDFWTQWWNYATGAASNEISNESDLSSDIQSSERLRVRSLINEFKTQPLITAIASVMAKSPQYAVSIFSRFAMNSFDAASTTSLMRKSMIQNTYDSLIVQGKTPTEALALMDQALKVPASIEKEIEIENKRIANLMRKAGLTVTDAMLAQNRSDMRLSAYEDVIRGEAAKAGASIKQASEITKALIESAQNKAKTLGGKKRMASKDLLTGWIYAGADAVLKPQKNLFESVRRAEMDGDLNKASKLQVQAAIYQNFVGKFVSGAANFMALALTATPLGLLAGFSLRKQRQEYLSSTAGAGANNIFAADPEQIKRYAELNGMMKSVFTRTLMGSTAMALFVLNALAKGEDGDDGEDESWFENLMQTKTGRRFIQKFFPVGIAMLTPSFYGDKDKKGEYRIDNILSMFDTYTGKDFDSYVNLRKSLKYAGDDEDERDEVMLR